MKPYMHAYRSLFRYVCKAKENVKISFSRKKCQNAKDRHFFPTVFVPVID